MATGTGGFRIPGEVVLWDIETGDVRSILRGHRSQVSGVAFAPDGKTLASSSDDTTVRIWDLESGKTLTTFLGHPGGVHAVAFSPDGKILASSSNGSEGTARLWDVTKAIEQKPE